MRPANQIPGLFRSLTKSLRKGGATQALDMYFDESFADDLENWGVDHVWPEIALLLAARQGTVLDLACGSGNAYDFIKQNPALEYFGCDISSGLIKRAARRGILEDRLRVMDATKLEYSDKSFDFVFSIGSLEHFTEAGLTATIAETHRVCRGVNFHMVPVSASQYDEGWIIRTQSYWNNSVEWWTNKFARSFGSRVWVMHSKWRDGESRGIWLIAASV